MAKDKKAAKVRYLNTVANVSRASNAARARRTPPPHQRRPKKKK